LFTKRIILVYSLILITGALGVYLFISNLNRIEDEKKHDKLLAVHKEAVEKVNNSIDGFATLISGLRAFIESNDSIQNQITLQKYINRTLDEIDYKDSIVVSYLDTNHIFKYSFTRTDFDPVGLVGKSAIDMRDTAHIERLDNLMKDSLLHLFHPINLFEGWPGIPLNFSVRDSERSIGYIAPIINFGKIIEPVYQNKKTNDEFVFKFNIVDGSEFDRFAVYDGYKIYSKNKDSENYKKFNIPENQFVYTVIEKYNLKFNIGTAFKSQKANSYNIALLTWLWYISVAVASLFILRNYLKTKKINRELELADTHIRSKNEEIQQQNEEILTQIELTELQKKELAKNLEKVSLAQGVIQQKNVELQKLSLIASKTDNYVIIISKDDEIEWVNDGFTRISGYTLEEVMGKAPSQIIAGEFTNLEVIKDIDFHIFTKKIAFVGEIINYKKDKTSFVSEIEAVPILNSDDEVKSYFVIGRDISEKKMQRKELQEQRGIALTQTTIIKETLEEVKKSEQLIKKQHSELKQLSHVVSSTDNSAMIIDRNGKVEWVNKGFTKLYGFTYEEFTQDFDNILSATQTHL